MARYRHLFSWQQGAPAVEEIGPARLVTEPCGRTSWSWRMHLDTEAQVSQTKIQNRQTPSHVGIMENDATGTMSAETGNPTRLRSLLLSQLLSAAWNPKMRSGIRIIP